MKQVSTFTGNIVSDLDVSKIKSDQIVFPTVGIRIFNKNGKGLIATIVPGNEEFFSISDGFQIIGACEFESVAYIASLNITTGEGEIGTYPRPNLGSAGFTKAYSPLMNLDSVGPGWGRMLRTTLFNFDIHHPVDIVCKKSYDNTVDIYFIDFYNPDRVINNGFKVTGEVMPRYVRSSQFDGALNHVPFTNKEIKVNSASVTSGGYLKPGNIFVYIKYLTENYASTNFVKEIGPFSIATGDTQLNHTGQQEKNWTTGIDNLTDRKINISLGNLDMNFTYFQVGIIRYSATTENGPAQQDVWLISNYYPITTADQSFSIYGNETQESLTYAQVISPPFEYPISKTQVALDKRLLKANVKRSLLNYNRDSLIAFAQQVVVGECYYDGDFATNNVQSIVNAGLFPYSSADNVYQYLGYFKEQIYPFACIFKFIDGTLSEAFPVKGNLGQAAEKGLYQFKSWKGACRSNPNQNRISGVEFVTYYAAQYYQSHIADFTDVVGFYFARADRIDNFLCQGVIMHGYHGVRTTMMPGSTPIKNNSSFQGEDGQISGLTTTLYNPSTASIMPLFRGYMPTSHGHNSDYYYGYTDDNNDPNNSAPQAGLDYQINGYDGWNAAQFDASVANSLKQLTLPARWHIRNATDPGAGDIPSMFDSTDLFDNSHGIFSPDLLFDNGGILIPPTAVVEPLFKFDSYNTSDIISTGTRNPYLITGVRNMLPPTSTGRKPIIGIDLNQANGIAYADDLVNTADVPVIATKVAHLQGRGELNFAGYFSGDGTTMGFDVMTELWNRDIGTSAYVGIQDNSATKTLRGCYAQYTAGTESPDNTHYDHYKERTCIVNLYKNSMTSQWKEGINNAFNVASVQYNPITDLTLFSDLGGGITLTCFKGDCFLQKVWFRTHRWYAITHNEQQSDPSVAIGGGYGREYVDNSSNHYWYQHGFMVGMTVECRYNAGMRNEVLGSNTDNLFLKYTFFPKAMQDGIDLDQWIAVEAGKYLQEATQINAGYDKVLSDKTYKGYDFTQPAFEQSKPNRVYASDAQIAGAFLDAYRSIQANTYQDFSIEDGDIHYIGKNGSYAYIVQRNGTNQIFVNERSMGTNDQGQDVILGTSLIFFSDKVERIGWFGTQHKSSIVSGAKGTYGYDALQNVWWFLNTERMLSGQSRLKMEDLGAKHLISDELLKILNAFSTQRDAVYAIPDDPLSGSGIVAWYDADNEEIGMTFLLPVATAVNQHLLRTLVFSEKIDGFRGDYPFMEHLYFNLGNMLLSQHSKYKQVQAGLLYTTDEKVYLYNQTAKANGTPNFATFFTNPTESMISFIINGLNEKENTSELIKIFNAMDIEMKDVPLEKIIFTTQYQEADYDFATTDLWQTAEYLAHKWHVPILIQSSTTDDAYEQNSELTGAWLKVTFVYNGDTDIELKSVITDFDISYD